MLDVTRTAEEPADVAALRFADFAAVDLLVSILLGDEPEPFGLGTRLRRVALGAVHEESHRYEVGDSVGPGPAAARPRRRHPLPRSWKDYRRTTGASLLAVGHDRTSYSAGATAQSTGNGQRKPCQPDAPDHPRGTAPLSLNGERRLRQRRHGGRHPTAAPHRGPGDATDPRFTHVLAAATLSHLGDRVRAVAHPLSAAATTCDPSASRAAFLRSRISTNRSRSGPPLGR
ncbi:hypothetical protein [Streptomyces sp. 11x1]|uniref:hypothetical protein n=1 Tax=Streptomyces sp. 11x1 TaxID=3038642 RepID=UPI00292FAE0D|nr:hypothetical protein [Streptomyces sp. 11x1]WNZ08714.1 hypothetical protein P8T65_14720 [Streptomyces sp. 11x1]